MQVGSKRYTLMLILLSSYAWAQVSTGKPAFGSFGGGPFDTVNLGNLNVHFSIPVLHKANRGMQFYYDLSYDGSVWTPVTSGGVTQWQPASNWGWKGLTEAKTGYITNTTTSTTSMNCTTKTYSNYVYHDPFGAAHPFWGTAMWRFSPTKTCTELFTPLTVTATDGSGYTLNIPVVDAGQVTSRGGRVSIVPLNNTSGAGTETDANGNQMTVNSSGQFFDTLSSSTPVLTVAGSGTPSSPTTFTYTAPGANAAFKMNFTQYTVKTDFVVSGISEYGKASVPLVSSVATPDGSSYSFSYEKTPGSCTPISGTYSANCVTARISEITLNTGGTITYSYSGGNNGIFSDGSTAGLTRTLSPGGEWQYSRTKQSGTPGPGSTWQTSVTDPTGNNTVINFSEDGTTNTSQAVATYNLYETQRVINQGGSALTTIITCYNGNSVGTPSSCPTTAVSSPILRTTVFRYVPNANGVQAETDTTIDGFGLTHEVDEYDYGASGSSKVGSLIRKTITQYAALGNGIVDRPSSVTVEDASNNSKAYTSYGYDATTPTATSGTPQQVSITGSRGLLTSVLAQANGTTNLYRKYTYYDTGNLSTSTDVSTSSTTNGATTTYNYASGSSCGNSFVTSISEPLGLSRSMTWNCTGGVMLSLTDENNKTSSTAYSGTNYTNLFWRPYSTTDQAGNITDYFYYLNSSTQPFQTESKSATFNSGNSIVDVVTTNDGFGRTIFRQTKQGPSASNYDTVANCYDSLGRVSLTTMSYSSALIGSGAPCPSTNPGNSYAYDALNRQTSMSNTGGGSTTFTYFENDVLQTVSSPIQKKQLENDALGRLESVCEITAGTTAFPGGNCAQNSPQTGYWTTYSYDLLGNLTGVTQNAQASSGQQTRSYSFDMLGRMTTETNPESGKTTYAYDSLPSTCYQYNTNNAGNRTGVTDANGNTLCYEYDSLHRLIDFGPGNGSPNPAACKRFAYDTGKGAWGQSGPTGYPGSDVAGRLVEAETDNCSAWPPTPITDDWFSYSPRGETTDTYESTPNSGGYYHLTWSYWPNGVVASLSGLPGVPTITYGTEGEGRWNTVSASSGQNPVTLTSYNAVGQVTGVTFGSGDSDAFQYDPNTGKMNQYTFTVNGQSVIGKPTWNTNGTLQQFQITQDPFNSANVQTCTYVHDDLGRVASSSCTSSPAWSQTFSFDPFSNITKSGSISFAPTYNTATNQMTSLPGAPACNSQTGNSVCYDANGNLTNDTFHTYQWDANGHPITVDSSQQTYDALGRMVELNSPGFSAQYLYDINGRVFGDFHSQGGGLNWISLPGGAVASFSGGSLQNYTHADWLGTTRFSSTPSRTLTKDWAVAPYGESYVAKQPGQNAIDLFAGNAQDIAIDLWDAQFREYHSTQGRWISPDPAGVGGANPANPQTWNRYAYVGNRPLNTTDPSGLVSPICEEGDDSCGGGGGWGCDPILGCPCDPTFDPSCGGNPPIISPIPLPPGGGTAPPSPPQRQGGVWANNQTSGLPTGLGNSPFNLGDLLGLSPGTQCGDFVACGTLGEGFTSSIPIEETVPICLAQPEICIIAGGIVLEAAQLYLQKKLADQIVQSSYSYFECVQQYIKDLKACKEAYPPGPDRENCFEKAAEKFRTCKAGGTIQ